MWGYFNSAVSLGASMLPAQVTETLSQVGSKTSQFKYRYCRFSFRLHPFPLRPGRTQP